MPLLRILITLFLLFISIESVFASYILSAPPRENSKAGEKYYGPIAKELSKIIGEEIIYQHPKNWTEYAKYMQAGKYDIVFDGPHFAAWRIKHVGHVPIARLSGSLRFYVLAHKDDTKVKSMRSLIGKQLCGLASPNLGTVTAFNLYKNPVNQPEIMVIKGGMREVLKKFLDGSCQTAVVRDKIYNKLPDDQKAKIRIIAKSQNMPNQSITVSTRFDTNKIDEMSTFLTSALGSASAESLLERFSKKKKYFILSKTNEYKGLAELLEGVVFGW